MNLFGLGISKAQLISLAVLILLALAIPLSVYLIQQQQVLKSKASEGTRIEFVNEAGSLITQTSSASVKLKLTYSPPTLEQAPIRPESVIEPNEGEVEGVSKQLAQSQCGGAKQLPCLSTAPDPNSAFTYDFSIKSWVASPTNPTTNDLVSFTGSWGGVETFKNGRGNFSVPGFCTAKITYELDGVLKQTRNTPGIYPVPNGNLSFQAGKLTAAKHTAKVCISLNTPAYQCAGSIRDTSANNNCKSASVTVTAVRPSPAVRPGVSTAPVSTFPTHFRVANSEAGLTTAPEQEFNNNPVIFDWVLPSGVGTKTVYAQFKIVGVWQEVLTATITLTPPDEAPPGTTPEVSEVPRSTSVASPSPTIPRASATVAPSASATVSPSPSSSPRASGLASSPTASPTTSPTPRPSIQHIFDLNHDGKVNSLDAAIFLATWRRRSATPSDTDYNSDGIINGVDWANFKNHFKP